ncbi:MAG: glycosyltransferase family 2 protein [Bacteroidia bacterium]|nr:MAG: glycosyltransferase family 2 protein [Bacteroidia bacterium]
MSLLPKGISVIICCYNSATRLPATLQHLADQQVPDNIHWEIILVNNASTDDTETVAYQEWKRLGQPVPIRIIYEAQPGIDKARRAGAHLAAYCWIVFCDDDNWLYPDYITSAFHLLKKNPDIGLIGGQGEPVADVQIPDWFEALSGHYAACSLGNVKIDLTNHGIWGAGMSGQTTLLKHAMHPSHPLLNPGRMGSNTAFGDDGEICMRVALQGYRIVYSPELKYKHYIPQQRLTESYRDALLQQERNQAEVMATYHRMLRWINEPYWKKLLISFFHLYKFIFMSFSGKKLRLSFSKDYLYFSVRWKLFETSYNKHVWLYHKSLKDLCL